MAVPLVLLGACADADKGPGGESVDASSLGGFSSEAEDAGAGDGRPEGSDGGGTGGATPSVDACNLVDVGYCFELEDYDATEAWCTDLRDLYGLGAEYSARCEDESVLLCDMTGLGGDFPADAGVITGYFAAWYWSEAEAYEACYSAGGEPL